MFSYRHKLQVLLIVFFLFITFAAVAPSDSLTEGGWIPWATLVIFLVLLLITDLIFLDDSQFKFDPNYKNWARQIDPKY